MKDIISDPSEQALRRNYYIDHLVQYFKDNHASEPPVILNMMVRSYITELQKQDDAHIRQIFLNEALSVSESFFLKNGIQCDHGRAMLEYISTAGLFGSEYKPYFYKGYLSVEEAAALFMRCNPKIINSTFIHENKEKLCHLELVLEFFYTFQLLLRAVDNGILKEQNSLLSYYNFFKAYGIEVMEITSHLKLTEKGQDVMATDPDWENKYQQLEQEFNQFKQDLQSKPEPEKHESQTKRKLNNAMKLLYCIAYEEYGYRVGVKGSTPSDLSSHTTLHKVRISPDTIRGYLEEGAALVDEDATDD